MEEAEDTENHRQDLIIFGTARSVDDLSWN